MPASGGSLSDTNVSTNKVVDGQSHYLAYITPDEGKSLMDQGGKETITDSGIPAYPPPGEKVEEDIWVVQVIKQAMQQVIILAVEVEKIQWVDTQIKLPKK